LISRCGTSWESCSMSLSIASWAEPPRTSPAVHPRQREGSSAEGQGIGLHRHQDEPHVADRIDDRSVIQRPWNLKRAVKTIEDMRVEAGDGFDILIDAHGLLTPVMALEFAKAVEPYRIMFLEEPIQLEGNDTLEWLGQHTTVPLATGERHTTKWMFEDLISRHLVSYVQPDVIQCGGSPRSGKSLRWRRRS